MLMQMLTVSAETLMFSKYNVYRVHSLNLAWVYANIG